MTIHTYRSKPHEKPCDNYSGNLCTGFGNDDTTCWICGWDRFAHPPYNIGMERIVTDVTTRRAEFVYEGARIAAIAAGAPIIPAPWDDREEPFRKQFLEVIERQCGPDRKDSPAELHQDWWDKYVEMGWRYGEVYDPVAKTHPDMVPYDDLGQLEQDKDAVFVALCEIARQWVRG